MSDTARVLLTAAVLSAIALASFAWRVTRVEADDAERLIGELRLMQWSGVMLAGVSGVPIGLALAAHGAPLAHLDIALAAMFIGLSGLVLQRDPREGLLLACAGFFAHALLDIAHRPGWLSPDLAPRWYTIGCAVHNVFLAGWCFWVREAVRPGGTFRDAVFVAVRAIPAGRVCTYGDVARLAGRPSAARAVGRVLAGASVPGLPYHRVIGAGGLLGGYGSGPAFKAAKLIEEGLVVRRGRVASFARCRWTGHD